MKVFIAIFALLGIGSMIAAYWNPIHVVTAFCCLLMVINGFAHIKESV